MEVREGYQQTEIGMIPKDWKMYQISDLIDFEGGAQPDKNSFAASQKQGYIRLIQIRDYKTDKYATYIPISLARRFCTKTDIMIGRYGPPVFQILRGINGAYNVALIKAIPNDNIDKTYAYYYLKQEKLFIFIDKLSRRSSGQTGVDLRELRAYPLPLPPKPEQQAIAIALSNTDALIDSLEKLIEKKRHIKQGAMQELLTGKRRLPGFEVKQGYKQTEIGEIPEDWETSKLQNHVEITSGDSPSKFIFKESGVPYYKVEQLNNANKYLSKETPYFIETKNKVPKNSVIFPKRGAAIFLNKIRLLADDAFFDTNLMALTIYTDGLSTEYLFYILDFNGLDQIADTTSVPQINNKHINPFVIPVPPKSEQQAIATVLSDMDSEIESLEHKLQKTREIKDGMMHELLTGRIRLV